MTDRIQLSELKGAIEKAAAKASTKIGHGPIIMGFVAPGTIKPAEAEMIAKEVAAHSGVKGEPTVITEGVAAAGLKHKTEALSLPHIIIGLILDPNARAD